MFPFEYQFRLDCASLSMRNIKLREGRQNLSLLNQVFGASETRRVRFNRLTDKLYIDMDWDTVLKLVIQL